eukprot:4472494-Prymnesium_polylepis.1
MSSGDQLRDVRSVGAGQRLVSVRQKPGAWWPVVRLDTCAHMHARILFLTKASAHRSLQLFPREPVVMPFSPAAAQKRGTPPRLPSLPRPRRHVPSPGGTAKGITATVF